jgi:hypothetical protein
MHEWLSATGPAGTGSAAAAAAAPKSTTSTTSSVVRTTPAGGPVRQSVSGMSVCPVVSRRSRVKIVSRPHSDPSPARTREPSSAAPRQFRGGRRRTVVQGDDLGRSAGEPMCRSPATKNNLRGRRAADSRRVPQLCAAGAVRRTQPCSAGFHHAWSTQGWAVARGGGQRTGGPAWPARHNQPLLVRTQVIVRRSRWVSCDPPRRTSQQRGQAVGVPAASGPRASG